MNILHFYLRQMNVLTEPLKRRPSFVGPKIISNGPTARMWVPLLHIMYWSLIMTHPPLLYKIQLPLFDVADDAATVRGLHLGQCLLQGARQVGEVDGVGLQDLGSSLVTVTCS